MDFFGDYLNRVAGKARDIDGRLLEKIAGILLAADDKGGKTLVFGNGGSAAIASHVAVDLSNAAKVRCSVYSDSGLITCLSNDYGFENWVAKAIEMHAEPADVVILISSSGRSKNMLNAAAQAKRMGMQVVTFTGFAPDNPLRQTGDTNCWVDSSEYNVVELTHGIWLAAIVDYLARRLK